MSTEIRWNISPKVSVARHETVSPMTETSLNEQARMQQNTAPFKHKHTGVQHNCIIRMDVKPHSGSCQKCAWMKLSRIEQLWLNERCYCDRSCCCVNIFFAIFPPRWTVFDNFINETRLTWLWFILKPVNTLWFFYSVLNFIVIEKYLLCYYY